MAKARTDPDSAAIVTAIIAMAKSLHLSVIAERVEIEEEELFLQERGCYKIQGYFHIRPLPVDKMTPFLKNSRSANVTLPPPMKRGVSDLKNNSDHKFLKSIPFSP